jgi:hypothetical protein
MSDTQVDQQPNVAESSPAATQDPVPVSPPSASDDSVSATVKLLDYSQNPFLQRAPVDEWIAKLRKNIPLAANEIKLLCKLVRIVLLFFVWPSAIKAW